MIRSRSADAAVDRRSSRLHRRSRAKGGRTLYQEGQRSPAACSGARLSSCSTDDASEPARASTLTKRLIESDRVDLIIGGTVTPSAMAMIPLVERAEVPYISVGGGLAIVDPVKKWVFKTPHTDRQVAMRILARHQEARL